LKQASSTILGYGVLGATALGSETIKPMLTATLHLNFDIGGLNNPQRLVAGLLDSSFTRDDFTSLDFSISGPSGDLFSETFDSGEESQAFLGDRILDLGLLSDFGPELELVFTYSLLAANGSHFDFNFIPGNASPVPLPPAFLLFATGLLGLICFRKKFVRT
jgi:hypothetical protein